MKALTLNIVLLITTLCSMAHGDWMSETRKLTEDVEARRLADHRKHENLVALTNYTNSNYLWFYKEISYFDEVTKSTKLKCESSKRLMEYKTCSNDFLDIYEKMTSTKASILSTRQSITWKHLENNGADLKKLGTYLDDIYSSLSTAQTDILLFVRKVDKKYAKSYAINWTNEVKVAVKKIMSCKLQKKKAFALATESRTRVLGSNMAKDAYLASSSFKAALMAQKEFTLYKEICPDDTKINRLEKYINKSYDLSKKISTTKHLLSMFRLQCAKINAKKHRELNEVCESNIFNSYSIYALHRATHPRPSL